MTATTRQPVGQAGARWVLLLRPRWLAWHAFVVLATAGMLYLGDWQLHRAESGNELSWAYTFEWPLFAGFAVYFWFKSLRDELREGGAEPGAAEPEPGAAESAAAASASGAVVTAAAAAGGIAAATAIGTLGAVETAPAAGRRAASWDATSWDATSWAATGGLAVGRETAAGGTGSASSTGSAGSAGSAGGTGQPVDVARATPADGEAYVARLRAEVERSGRRRRR